MTYFISGHLDCTAEEFSTHYSTIIQKLAFFGHSFIVGDARGADTLAQKLLSRIAPKATTVYHMFDKPRNCVSPHFKTVGGFTSDNERDTAMTVASDRDIAWVRPGRETSGTAKNLKRRK